MKRYRRQKVTLFMGNKHFRHMLVAATVVSGIALSILVSLSSYYKDEKLRHEQFNTAVENHYFALQREIDDNMYVLESLRALYLSTQDLERPTLLDRAEFRDFAYYVLKHHASIQSLGWIPRVPDSERKSYESAARRDGFPDFQFTERMPQGKMKRAEQRKEYFPIYFAEPSLGNLPYLGFDLVSDTALRTAMEKAATSGEILATGRITLPQATGNQFGFIVFAPVYRKGVLTNTDQARRDNLEGFMLGVFRINDLVEEAIVLVEPKGIEFAINDASASEEERFLYLHVSRLHNTPLVTEEQSEAGFRKTKALEVAGRQWVISYSATPEFIAATNIFYHWGLSLAGFAVTALVAISLFLSCRHAEQVEKSARELSNINAMLKREMMEHQHANDQLREKERLLSESQRLGHIGSFLYDMTGPIQWSDELYRIYGVSPDTFTPTLESLLGLIHPDDRTLMQDWTAACVAGEKPDALVFRINTPDGTVRFIKGWGDAVYDDENRVTCIAGIAQDITERKKAEEEILRLASFPTLNPNPVIELDNAGGISYLNPAAERMFPGLGAMGLSHPLLHGSMEIFADSRQGKKQSVIITESTIGEATFELHISYVQEINRIRIYVVDITKRKWVEDELLEKERLLSESQRLGHVGSFFIDDTGFMQWSKELYHIFGVSPDTFTPNMDSLLNLIHPEDQPSMQAWTDDCIAGKKPAALEFRVIFPDGTIHFVMGDGDAVFDGNNRFLYLAGSGQDITERKHAEEELQRYAAELEKKNQELQGALAEVKQLTGLLPICASCKKIRDDSGYWSGVETYVSEHTDAVFSHGLCPECEKKAHEDLENLLRENK